MIYHRVHAVALTHGSSGKLVANLSASDIKVRTLLGTYNIDSNNSNISRAWRLRIIVAIAAGEKVLECAR
jgi:hypothetical protein